MFYCVRELLVVCLPLACSRDVLFRFVFSGSVFGVFELRVSFDFV